MKIAKVQSSGKEGTEKAALNAARKVGIAVTGWVPKGTKAKEKELKESASTKYEQSVIWNVRDSHATIIFEPMDSSKAASLAYEVAEAYARPFVISNDSDEIEHWLNSLGEELTLNVIGPNEDESPGISDEVKKTLDKVFAEYSAFFLEM